MAFAEIALLVLLLCVGSKALEECLLLVVVQFFLEAEHNISKIGSSNAWDQFLDVTVDSRIPPCKSIILLTTQ